VSLSARMAEPGLALPLRDTRGVRRRGPGVLPELRRRGLRHGQRELRRRKELTGAGRRLTGKLSDTIALQPNLT